MQANYALKAEQIDDHPNTRRTEEVYAQRTMIYIGPNTYGRHTAITDFGRLIDDQWLSRNGFIPEQTIQEHGFLPNAQLAGRGKTTRIVTKDVTILAWWASRGSADPVQHAAVQIHGNHDAEQLWAAFCNRFPVERRLHREPDCGPAARVRVIR